MSSLKRSRPSALLERRVRPRKEEDSEVEEEIENLSEDDSAPSEDGAGESEHSEDDQASDNGENVSGTSTHDDVISTDKIYRNRKKSQKRRQPPR
jgi:ribosomal RNA-processing protein 36